jgi:hypothetical protein
VFLRGSVVKRAKKCKRKKSRSVVLDTLIWHIVPFLCLEYLDIMSCTSGFGNNSEINVRKKYFETGEQVKVFVFTALDQMTIHGDVVMDFLFIHPFGWIRIIIAWGRKSQKDPSDLNMISTLCGVWRP